MFYLYGIITALLPFGISWHSLAVAQLLLNLLFLVSGCLILSHQFVHKPLAAALAACLALFLLQHAAIDAAFVNFWPPATLVLPMFAFLTSCASLARGNPAVDQQSHAHSDLGKTPRPFLLPFTTFSAAVLLSQHLGTAPVLFPTLILTAISCRANRALAKIGMFPAVLTGAILVLSLLGPVLDLLHGWRDSNIRSIVVFLTTRSGSHSLFDSLGYVATFFFLPKSLVGAIAVLALVALLVLTSFSKDKAAKHFVALCVACSPHGGYRSNPDNRANVAILNVLSLWGSHLCVGRHRRFCYGQNSRGLREERIGCGPCNLPSAFNRPSSLR